MPNVYRSLAGSLTVALVTVLTWWAWLGRDTTLNYDPATDTFSGPYTTGQVAGAVLTLLLLLIAAVLLRVHPALAAAAMTISFVAAWTVSAAAQDDSGLFLVGAFLVTVGMAAGTTVVAAITSRFRRPTPPPADRAGVRGRASDRDRRRSGGFAGMMPARGAVNDRAARWLSSRNLNKASDSLT